MNTKSPPRAAAERDSMRPIETAGPWVVYRMPIRGKDGGMAALCSQREWDDMDRVQPGHFTLIRAGIANEGEAERPPRSPPPPRPAPPPTHRPTAASVFPVGSV